MSLQLTSAASGGLAISGEYAVASPPPPRSSHPQGWAAFPALVTSRHEEGLHECLAHLETDMASPPYINSSSSTLGTSSYFHTHLAPFVEVGIT